MKAGWTILLISGLAAGCAHPSRYQHDSRAAVVGPDYLDYVDQYPRDRDTQYYYPVFKVGGDRERGELFPEPENAAPFEIKRLLIAVPPAPPAVQAIEGKGWPELEREGIPFFFDRH